MVGSLAPSNMNGFNINEMITTIGLTTKPLQIGMQKLQKHENIKFGNIYFKYKKRVSKLLLIVDLANEAQKKNSRKFL